MATWSQENNSIGIETDLGDDVLILLGLSGSDYVSGMFHYSLELASEKPDLNPKDLIGKKVDIWIKLDDGSKRYINGHVKSFSAKAFVTQGYRHYAAEIVPWIWFMGRKSDCVVYQNQSATQVIESVLKDEPTANFQLSTSNTYSSLDYCVKYLETDLAFVTRLMSSHGLYYYFLHEKGKHTLVISDQVADYLDCLEGSIIHSEGDIRGKHMHDWQENYEFFTGNWVQQDYNYETPTTDLSASSKTVNDLAAAKDYEYYNYPGDYKKRDDGVGYTDTRMAREEQRFEKISANSDYRSLQAGTKFKISEHDFEAYKNKDYFITKITHEAFEDTYTSDSSGRRVYVNRLEAIPAATLFLGEGSSGKPVIYGHQTAVVVGPSGEEIYTDEFGRVKVQFHWDRYGQADENTSCWIRVSQAWAGKNWGALSLPRIGQEVVISFEDGDPDRPLIIGRVYNGELKPPHELPANKTMTTMKTNSSKGGGGFNEIRMEDKKDSEQIYMHAQKDMHLRVKNDRLENIDHDRSLIVGNIKKEHIKNERHEKVDSHHVEEIAGDRNLKVKGKEAKAVDGSLSLTVKSDVIEVFKAKHSEQVTDDYYLKASNIVIEGTDNVTIKVGQSFIAIESGGITIGSTGDIEIDSKAKVKIKGLSGLTAESPATVDVKGTNTTVKGDAMLTCQGGLVKIN